MFRPVLVTASTVKPVSLEEVKAALRVDGTDSDGELQRLIGSAIAHYEGWSGLLGISLVEQEWKQDFDCFKQEMRLPLGPVQSVTSVKWRNDAGQISTVSDDSYALKVDGGGRSYVRFKNNWSTPSDLYEVAPVSIEYMAGWPVVEAKATTPDDIKTAIILHVQKNFDEAARENALQIERIERDLISKYRAPIF
jgi:uncharacterized phiE125 gp8 family phage protein